MASPSTNSTCDPTWEICVSISTNQTSNPPNSQLNKTNSTLNSTNSTELIVNKGMTPLEIIWGTTQLSVFIESWLQFKAYRNFAYKLSSNNYSSKSAWTISYVQGISPIDYWFKSSQISFAINLVSILLWIAKALGGGQGGQLDALYVGAAQLSIVYPLATTYYSWTANRKYTDCSGLSSTQFDGTTSTVTQYVTCKDGTSARFGSSGTIAKYVTDDPYSTWYSRNLIAAASQLVINAGVYGPMTANARVRIKAKRAIEKKAKKAKAAKQEAKKQSAGSTNQTLMLEWNFFNQDFEAIDLRNEWGL